MDAERRGEVGLDGDTERRGVGLDGDMTRAGDVTLVGEAGDKNRGCGCWVVPPVPTGVADTAMESEPAEKANPN